MSLELATPHVPALLVDASSVRAPTLTIKERIFIIAFLRNIWWSLRTTLRCFAVDDSPIPSAAAANAEEVFIHDTLSSEDDTLVVETLGTHPVGWGGSSDVWKARLVRPSEPQPQPPLVAAKVLRIWTDRTKIGKTLRQEVKIWKLLSHPNISSFYGVVYNGQGTPAIISPWYDNGSADVYLGCHPEVNPMKLIWEIILGVEHLHERGIIHGDLKGANAMVDSTGHIKLIDFGLSRLIDATTGMTGGMTLTTVAFSVRWCAPEILISKTGQITTAADIFALASTALQLLTGEVPYKGLLDRQVLFSVLNKIPPSIPSIPLRHEIPNVGEVWSLLAQSWLDPLERPNIVEFKQQIHAFLPDSVLM